MSADILTVPFTGYEEYVYNLSLTGDENVIGIAKLEPIDNNVALLSSNLIKQALYYMYKRHPLMRANVIEEKINKNENEFKFKYYFEIYNESSRNENDMEFEYRELDNESLVVDELELFISKIFDFKNKCLLWRFKVITFMDKDNGKRIYVLALVLPLCITDGFNMTALCYEICNIINSLLSNSICDEMKSKFDLADNMHVALEKQNLYNDNVKVEVEKLVKNEKLVNFNLPYLFKTNSEVRKSKMALLKLNTDATSLIIKQSKLRKTRLTGYFVAVALQSFKKLYSEFNIEIQRDFSCIIPANLRQRLNPEVDFSNIRFLVFLTNINIFYPLINLETLSAEQIWLNAKNIQKAVVEKTKFENGSLLQHSHNFEFTDDMNNLFANWKIHENLPTSKVTSETNRFDFCDLILSNIGTHVENRKKLINEPYKLTEIYHGDSLTSCPNNFASCILHVCTLDNQLMFQLSANRNVFGSEYADRFMEIFKSMLELSVQF